MTEESIRRYDPSDMRKLLINFPQQIRDAVAIGAKASIPYKASGIDNIVATGLGGSAIGGDLLRTYLAGDLKVPFLVNRHYSLPQFVGPRTLVIASSYSGNTEETISAHKDAIRRKAKILCISSNGETQKLAARHRQPLLVIPRGYPPRAALGYSFFPSLLVLSKIGLIPSKGKEIKETIALLKKKAEVYAAATGRNNTAFELAKHLYGKLPILYSSADRFDVVNTRWRGQIAENGKVLAFGHVLPEMNHNELVGWKALRRIMEEDLAVVFLRDKGDHKRVQLRMGITHEIVSQYAGTVYEATSEGNSLLARMFSLIYLGDWVSYYLAILNGIDPTPVKVIDYLKNELGKVPMNAR